MKKYLLISILYLFGIGLIFLFNYNKPDSILGIFLTSLISLPFYVFLIRRYNYEHGLPLLIYLSMSLLRISIAGLYIALIFTNGTYLYLTPIFSSGYGSIYFGGLILVIGDLVFVISSLLFWDKLKRRRSSKKPIQITNSHNIILRNGVILLFLSILFNILGYFIDFSYFSSAFSYVMQYSGPAGLLLLAIYKSDQKKIPIGIAIFAWVFIAVTAVSLLGAFWKQTIITYLFPLCYFAYRSTIKKRKREKIIYTFLYGTLGVIVLTVVFNYTNYTRSLMYAGVRINDATRVKLLSDAVTSAIPFTESGFETNRLPDQGIWSILARSDLYTPAAWVYANVETYGYKQDMVENIRRSLTPRIFFPEKEPVAFGKELAVELGQAKDFESATTSIAYGMFPAYYRNYGWVGVILGSCISATLYSIMVFLSSGRYLYNPVMMIVYFSLIVESFRWFESGFDGGIAYFTLMFVVFIPASLVYEKIVLRKGWISRTNP